LPPDGKTSVASIHVYLHPLSLKDLPAFTRTIGSLLSNVLGETKTHRAYGGAILPREADGEAVESALRRALGIRAASEPPKPAKEGR